MDSDLERLIDARLQRLPAPSAPPTLHPRVMAAVAARHPHRRMRPFFAWPRAWQAAFAAALLFAVGGAGVWLSNASWSDWWVRAGWGGDAIARVTAAAHDVQAAIEATRIFMSAVASQPVVWCFAALVIVMTAACATFGAMLGRMANVRVQGAD